MERKKYEVDAIQSESGKYKLEGVVTDGDGNPLANVDLSIKSEDDEEYTATTDSDGKFLVEDVSGGKYSVSVQSDIYIGNLEYDVGSDGSDDSDDGDDDESDEGSSDVTDEGEASKEESEETDVDGDDSANEGAADEKEDDDESEDSGESDESRKD